VAATGTFDSATTSSPAPEWGTFLDAEHLARLDIEGVRASGVFDRVELVSRVSPTCRLRPILPTTCATPTTTLTPHPHNGTQRR